MTTPYYGQHLMGDIAGCERGTMQDPIYLTRFLAALVQALGMTLMAPPHVDAYHGPQGDGYSATAHITTSNITLHTFAHGYVFLDVFSCTLFDRTLVDTIVRQWFGTERTNAVWRTVERGLNYPPAWIDPRMKTAQNPVAGPP